MFADTFHPIEKLGEGAYGAVYKVMGSDGKQWAKKVNSTKGLHPWEIYVNELNIMSSLKHTNITPLMNTTASSGTHDEFAIIMPLADTTLENLAVEYKKSYKHNRGASPSNNIAKDQKTPVVTIDSKSSISIVSTSTVSSGTASSQVSPFPVQKQITYQMLLSYLYQAAIGILAMHNSKFLHLDIKTENILIFGNVAKVCDFSLSIGLLTKNDCYPGVDKFCDLARPPENKPKASTSPYNFSELSDVWAFGIMIVCTFCGGIYEVSQQGIQMNLLNDRLLLPQGVKQHVISLLDKIFVEKAKRISMRDVVNELGSMVLIQEKAIYSVGIPIVPYQFLDRFEVTKSDPQFSLSQLRPYYPEIVSTLNTLLSDVKFRGLNVDTWILCVELALQSAFNFFVTRKATGSFKTRASACLYLALRHTNEFYYTRNKRFFINIDINTEEHRLLRYFSGRISRKLILDGFKSRKQFLMMYHQMLNNLDVYYNRVDLATVKTNSIGLSTDSDIDKLSLNDFTH